MTQALAFRAPAVARTRNSDFSLDLIAKWVSEKPHAWALLHKKSIWHAYTWQHVATRIANLRGALAQEGVADGARFAVSGQIDAQLILIAVAAQANGATVIPIDRNADRATLDELLRSANITHAYVSERKTLATWLTVRLPRRNPVPLFSAHAVAGNHDAWSVQRLPHEIFASAASVKTQPQRKRPALKLKSALWVDEGTEWHNGLAEVIRVWLESGDTLAAPETSASASRDRAEIQPLRILASNARQRRIQSELTARLHPQGTLLRALADVGLRSSGNPLTAWIGKRIARLHGVPSDALQTAQIAQSGTRHDVSAATSDRP